MNEDSWLYSKTFNAIGIASVFLFALLILFIFSYSYYQTLCIEELLAMK